MRSRAFVSIMMVAVACAGCGIGREDAEKKALERRVAELEAQLKTSPTPAVPEATPTPEASPTATPAPPVAGKKPAPPRSSRPKPVATPPPPVRETDAAAGADAPPPMPVPASETAAAPAIVRNEIATTPEHWSIPDGATLDLVLETPVSTKTSVVGDEVVARIEGLSDANGPLPLPGGSLIEGRVTRVKGAGRVGSKALLAVVFDRITVRGLRQALEPVTVVVEGRSDLKRDGAMVAGGAVAGAIVGGIVGGKDGAAKGAAIGTAGGAGAAAVTKAEQVEIAAGEHWSVTVARSGSVQRE